MLLQVAFDHADPSIFTVLTCPSHIPGKRPWQPALPKRSCTSCSLCAQILCSWQARAQLVQVLGLIWCVARRHSHRGLRGVPATLDSCGPHLQAAVLPPKCDDGVHGPHQWHLRGQAGRLRTWRYRPLLCSQRVHFAEVEGRSRDDVPLV